MQEHLSPDVTQVIKLANAIAREYELEYIGTEHLLLGIGKQQSSLGAQILNKHGATYKKLKAQVDKLIQASLEDTWVFGRLPGSPHFRNVMARAIEEARALNSKLVCTEHLLLALILEKGSVAQKALRALDLSPRQVREAIDHAAADPKQAERT